MVPMAECDLNDDVVRNEMNVYRSVVDLLFEQRNPLCFSSSASITRERRRKTPPVRQADVAPSDAVPRNAASDMRDAQMMAAHLRRNVPPIITSMMAFPRNANGLRCPRAYLRVTHVVL